MIAALLFAFALQAAPGQAPVRVQFETEAGTFIVEVDLARTGTTGAQDSSGVRARARLGIRAASVP